MYKLEVSYTDKSINKQITMGYKKKATKINQENKKNREPIVRTRTGWVHCGSRTDPEVIKGLNENSLRNPSHANSFLKMSGQRLGRNFGDDNMGIGGNSKETIETFIAEKNASGKPGQRKIKQRL